MEGPKLIVDPQTGDTERAEDVLDEICGVLKRRGYVLEHTDRCMILAKVEAGIGHRARVIAEVKRITPDRYDWRKLDWSRNLTETKQ